ncbi:hypothetical protein GOODEAATRI_015614 [Goodea atripinnis]|uniref:Uncharacterized protein n=1 Tax=Goodea atripinnis TaxID=208336 RepID=A0ABV0N1Q4_9TELE
MSASTQLPRSSFSPTCSRDYEAKVLPPKFIPVMIMFIHNIWCRFFDHILPASSSCLDCVCFTWPILQYGGSRRKCCHKTCITTENLQCYQTKSAEVLGYFVF